jgi:hypothetical protein
MSLDGFWGVMRVVFLENFPITSVVCLLALAVLINQRFFRPILPRALALVCWSFLVVGTCIVVTALVWTYVENNEGTTRLALVPYVLCTSPLMLCGLLAILLFPAWKR